MTIHENMSIGEKLEVIKKCLDTDMSTELDNVIKAMEKDHKKQLNKKDDGIYDEGHSSGYEYGYATAKKEFEVKP